MPITELVLPSLKQDEETRNKFVSDVRPVLAATIRSAPGLKSQFFGRVLLENDVNVEGAGKYALGIEWENAQDFHDFLASEEFGTFKSHVKQFVSAPAKPEAYETDASPLASFSSPVTEVFRTQFEDGVRLAAVKTAWVKLVSEIKGELPGLVSVSGTSINLENHVFIGIIGWKGIEVRENALASQAVMESRSQLVTQLGVRSIVVTFTPN